jgi:hypothetical protein
VNLQAENDPFLHTFLPAVNLEGILQTVKGIPLHLSSSKPAASKKRSNIGTNLDDKENSSAN